MTDAERVTEILRCDIRFCRVITRGRHDTHCPAHPRPAVLALLAAVRAEERACCAAQIRAGTQ